MHHGGADAAVAGGSREHGYRGSPRGRRSWVEEGAWGRLPVATWQCSAICSAGWWRAPPRVFKRVRLHGSCWYGAALLPFRMF